MDVVLLGTGPPAGWPNPWCTCASCFGAIDANEYRGQTAALIDDVMLVDCGPEIPRAASRLGRSLSGVRHLLLTHAHFDHTSPAALLYREWAAGIGPLDVVGPPAALAICRDWVPPDVATITWHEVHAGDQLRLDGYDVRVLEAAHDPETGPPVLYDITGPDRTRLLYATDTGPLPSRTLDATAEAAYDVVLLEECCGEEDGRGRGHLDLRTFPEAVAALRANGAVTAATRVVAIHLSDANPPPAELKRILGYWGVEMHEDGAVLRFGEGAVGRRPVPGEDPEHRYGDGTTGNQPAPRRVLILGGARSGKSREAERRLLAEPDVTFVATARPRPDDDEWAARVKAHRDRRPPSWRTVETTDLEAVLRTATGAVLVDCLTLWLAAMLDDGIDVDTAIDEVVAAWRATSAHVVAVSNEVGSGVVPETSSGRRFRDALGVLNARIAAESDQVWLVTAGLCQRLR